MFVLLFQIQISLGTVANVDEAVEWLSYTYLYIRMRVNPLVYGIPYGTKEVCYLMYCCVMILILPSKVFSYKDIGGTHTYLQLRDIAAFSSTRKSCVDPGIELVCFLHFLYCIFVMMLSTTLRKTCTCADNTKQKNSPKFKLHAV